MKILALDTSTDACSAALLIENKITECYEIAPRRHTALILPMIQSLLIDAKLNLAELDALAFGCGPGSFTGVRIASSVVQGLAFAANLPVLSISTLLAMAQGAYQEMNVKQVLVAMDARMSEIYYGAYTLGDNHCMQTIGIEMVCSPSEIVVPNNSSWWGIGSGFSVYQEILQKQVGLLLQNTYPTSYPQARHICQLAAVAYEKNQGIAAPEDVSPVYLREKVVNY